jgi:hypothetical protein
LAAYIESTSGILAPAAVHWAAGVVAAGDVALLAADTAGDERAEYALTTGDPAVDRIVATTSVRDATASTGR